MDLKTAKFYVDGTRDGQVRMTDDDIHEAAILLLDETTRLNKELTLAYNEAASLALFLWKKHYSEIAPDWGLCDSAAGIISQIDNMVCQLVKAKT